MNNLLRRTLTGLFIVVFIFGGFWLHPVSYAVTGLILLIGMQYEYYRMVKAAGSEPQTAGGILAGSLVYALSVFVSSGFLDSKWFIMIVPVPVLLMIIELYRQKEKPFDSLAHTFFPVVYIALPLSFFPYAAFGHTGIDTLIRHDMGEFSPAVVLGFFLLLWANDTGAYLVGVTLGRHRLMERISPKKSWEGFAGGMVITTVVAWFIPGLLGVADRKGWIITGIIISVAGTYGDLVESMLKRSLGVKDSGNILPGHGGFLDRFDSLLLAFPLVYLYLTVFG